MRRGMSFEEKGEILQQQVASCVLFLKFCQRPSRTLSHEQASTLSRKLMALKEGVHEMVGEASRQFPDAYLEGNATFIGPSSSAATEE